MVQHKVMGRLCCDFCMMVVIRPDRTALVQISVNDDAIWPPRKPAPYWISTCDSDTRRACPV